MKKQYNKSKKLKVLLLTLVGIQFTSYTWNYSIRQAAQLKVNSADLASDTAASTPSTATPSAATSPTVTGSAIAKGFSVQYTREYCDDFNSRVEKIIKAKKNKKKKVLDEIDFDETRYTSQKCPNFNINVSLIEKTNPRGVKYTQLSISRSTLNGVKLNSKRSDCSYKGLFTPAGNLNLSFDSSEEEVQLAVQQKIDENLDKIADKCIKDSLKQIEEEIDTEIAEFEKQQKIDRCELNEDGEDFKSASVQLGCKINTLSNVEKKDRDSAARELKTQITELLKSNDETEYKEGLSLLAKLRKKSGLTRDLRAELTAMNAGARYSKDMSQLVRTHQSTDNLWVKQMTLGKIKALDQSYNYDYFRFSNNPSASQEFDSWRLVMQQQVDMALNQVTQTIQSIGSQNVTMPSQLNLTGRLARANGINPITQESLFTSYDLGTQVTNALLNSSLTTNTGTRIPSVGARVP